MDPDTFFHHANICFVNENYTEAEKNYTLAIELKDGQCLYHSNRAEACLKLGKLDDALLDVDRALQAQADHKPSIFRRGKILFALQRYEDARDTFRRLETDSKLEMWLRKCDAELSGEQLLVTPSTKASSFDKKPEKTESQAVQPQETSSVDAKPSSAIRHQWYQSATTVNLSIFVKNRQRSDIDVDFNEDSLYCGVKLPNNEDFVMDLSLFSKIIPEKSKVEVGAVKVVIQMEKATEGESWGSLEKKSQLESAGPSYPTSSKNKTNWADMDKTCQKQLDEDKPEGDEALNTLFKEIYGNANEETRRAMIKSFQTSGGTVLSTNWDEVGKADYEGKDRPDAPEGQQWAK